MRLSEDLRVTVSFSSATFFPIFLFQMLVPSIRTPSEMKLPFTIIRSSAKSSGVAMIEPVNLPSSLIWSSCFWALSRW